MVHEFVLACKKAGSIAAGMAASTAGAADCEGKVGAIVSIFISNRYRMDSRQLENSVGRCLRRYPEDSLIVVIQVVAPAARQIDASAITTGYLPFELPGNLPQIRISQGFLQQSCWVRIPVFGMPMRLKEFESVSSFRNQAACSVIPTI